jgi:hypothetical protein
MIARINRAYVIHYSDNGQTKAYVEWTDTHGKHGRTEGAFPCGVHMQALFDRAEREGLKIIKEHW